jgi:hypothetical protein
MTMGINWDMVDPAKGSQAGWDIMSSEDSEEITVSDVRLYVNISNNSGVLWIMDLAEICIHPVEAWWVGVSDANTDICGTKLDLSKIIHVSASGAPMDGVNRPNVSVSEEAEDSLLVSTDDAMETDDGYSSDGYSDICSMFHARHEMRAVANCDLFGVTSDITAAGTRGGAPIQSSVTDAAADAQDGVRIQPFMTADAQEGAPIQASTTAAALSADSGGAALSKVDLSNSVPETAVPGCANCTAAMTADDDTLGIDSGGATSEVDSGGATFTCCTRCGSEISAGYAQDVVLRFCRQVSICWKSIRYAGSVFWRLQLEHVLLMALATYEHQASAPKSRHI